MRQNKTTQRAIRGLKKHDDINEAGGHHLIGFEMAKKLPPVNEESVLNGCYIFSQYLSYYQMSQYNIAKTISEI